MFRLRSVPFSLINQYIPDIIVGTESWLTPAINSSEIFPSNYNIYRRNHPDGYDGVFLACKGNLISEELSLSTTCELVACKIHLAHHYLIVCSLYRPPDRNLPYLEEPCVVLKHIILTNPNAIIWFAGDLNLPNIYWNLTASKVIVICQPCMYKVCLIKHRCAKVHKSIPRKIILWNKAT